MRVLNTVNDAKIVHNASILINEKDDAEEELIRNKVETEGVQAGATIVYEHTIIVNLADDPSEFNMYQVDLDWTLKRLTKFLEEKNDLDTNNEHRLRSLKENRIFHLEEMDTKLKAYEDFQEGGTRIQIELGRPTTLAEIAISVMMHRKEDDIRQYYFNADITVKDAK